MDIKLICNSFQFKNLQDNLIKYEVVCRNYELAYLFLNFFYAYLFILFLEFKNENI